MKIRTSAIKDAQTLTPGFMDINWTRESVGDSGELLYKDALERYTTDGKKRESRLEGSIAFNPGRSLQQTLGKSKQQSQDDNYWQITPYA